MEGLALMPKYEAYKDSYSDYSGLIPCEWKLIPIRAIFEERNEKNTGPKTDHILSVTRDRGVIPYDEKGAIGNNKSEDIERYKLVYENDLVINKMNVVIGSLGLSKYFGALSQVYIVLRPKTKSFNIRYYAYLFHNEPFYKSLIRYCTGIMELRESLNKEQFKQLYLPFPTFEEQTLIANFLDKKTTQINDAIAIKEQQISLLKERKQIIIQQAVTQGLDPNVPMKDSGVDWIGKVPAHWELTRLKFHSKIQSGITLGKTYKTNNPIEIQYIRVANVQFGYFKLDDVAVLNLPMRELERYLLQDKDILVTEGGDIDKLGRGTVWKSEITPCIHQNHVFAIRIDLTKFRHDFVANYLAADSTRKHFISTATKTTNLASTNRTHLGNLYLPILSIQEQDEINSFIFQQSSFIEAGITDLEAQIEKLKEYKTTLINSAVTGKIKITPEMVEQ